ncbi:hypothetical protein [uncultured Pontibacter sp.]|uniref:hypothetical protein n=1 Tax=uncultured Pontibacter sp. TaxID=453356 RepID=UPI00261BC48C|nr:hypothetical protein [uncultured Pontibacter sp.]
MSTLENYLEVKLLTSEKLIFSKFSRPPGHEAFKQGMLFTHSLIKEHGVENWLIDATQSLFTMQDQKWAIEQLGALVNDTALGKVAMVHNNDAMLEIAADTMRTKIYRIHGLLQDLQYFATLPEALTFLLPNSNPDELIKAIKAADNNL